MELKLDGLDTVLAVLNPRIYTKSLNRTVNDIGGKVRTQIVKSAGKKYNISAAELKDERVMKVSKSNYSTMNYSLVMRSKRLNAKRFGAKKLKRKGNVSIKIIKTTKSKKLKRAFFAKNGAVLMREKNSQKIRAVTTVSIPQMFNKKTLKDANDLVSKEFGDKATI